MNQRSTERKISDFEMGVDNPAHRTLKHVYKIGKQRRSIMTVEQTPKFFKQGGMTVIASSPENLISKPVPASFPPESYHIPVKV
jgi:hypothetical protein